MLSSQISSEAVQDDLAQIEVRLSHQNMDERLTALDKISSQMQAADRSSSSFIMWMNTICLKLADIIGHSATKNDMRNEIIERVFQPNAQVIEQCFSDKGEFMQRVGHQFNTNDPQQRICILRILQCCPSLIQNNLMIQHNILFLLTTGSQDRREKAIANTTIQHIASKSESFAKSIMSKVEESVLSGKYDAATCKNLIQAISFVPGDSNCAILFFETVRKLIEHIPNAEMFKQLATTILHCLLKMTMKVPLLFAPAMDLLLADNSSFCDRLKLEAVAILSRAYSLAPFSSALARLVNRSLQSDLPVVANSEGMEVDQIYKSAQHQESLPLSVEQARAFLIIICANQRFKFGPELPETFKAQLAVSSTLEFDLIVDYASSALPRWEPTYPEDCQSAAAQATKPQASAASPPRFDPLSLKAEASSPSKATGIAPRKRDSVFKINAVLFFLFKSSSHLDQLLVDDVDAHLLRNRKQAILQAYVALFEVSTIKMRYKHQEGSESKLKQLDLIVQEILDSDPILRSSPTGSKALFYLMQGEGIQLKQGGASSSALFRNKIRLLTLSGEAKELEEVLQSYASNQRAVYLACSSSLDKIRTNHPCFNALFARIAGGQSQSPAAMKGASQLAGELSPSHLPAALSSGVLDLQETKAISMWIQAQKKVFHIYDSHLRGQGSSEMLYNLVLDALNSASEFAEVQLSSKEAKKTIFMQKDPLLEDRWKEQGLFAAEPMNQESQLTPLVQFLTILKDYLEVRLLADLSGPEEGAEFSRDSWGGAKNEGSQESQEVHAFQKEVAARWAAFKQSHLLQNQYDERAGVLVQMMSRIPPFALAPLGAFYYDVGLISNFQGGPFAKQVMTDFELSQRLHQGQGIRSLRPGTIPIKYDSDLEVFMNKITLQASRPNFEKIEMAKVQYTLLQYHSETIQVDSCSIIQHREVIVDCKKDPTVNLAIKFPSIGSYLLRVEVEPITQVKLDKEVFSYHSDSSSLNLEKGTVEQVERVIRYGVQTQRNFFIKCV